jgi:hypothetical protein
MVDAKKIIELTKTPENWPVILFFLLFPFGQILRQRFFILGLEVRLQPLDLASALSVLYFLYGKLRADKVFVHLFNFILVSLFSLVLSLTYFPLKNVFFGSFYMVRLFSYLTFYLLLKNVIKKYSEILLVRLLLLSVLTAAIFGWLQYFLFPDLRSLKFIGWTIIYIGLQGLSLTRPLWV